MESESTLLNSIDWRALPRFNPRQKLAFSAKIYSREFRSFCQRSRKPTQEQPYCYLFPIGREIVEVPTFIDTLVEFLQLYIPGLSVRVAEPLELFFLKAKDQISQLPPILIPNVDAPSSWRPDDAPDDDTSPIDTPSLLLCKDASDFQTQSAIKSSRNRLSIRSRFHRASGHRQVNCLDLVNALAPHIPKDGFCAVGLTLEDLFWHTTDQFCMGLASLGGETGVFSFSRYHPALWWPNYFWFGLKKGRLEPEDDRTMILRGCKTLVHEVLHIFGVTHCTAFECCMNESNNWEDDFAIPIHLCPICLRQLEYVCSFDAIKRWTDLLAFFQKHAQDDEVEIITAQLQSIQNLKKVSPSPKKNSSLKRRRGKST